jgi:hypothetical protein
MSAFLVPMAAQKRKKAFSHLVSSLCVRKRVSLGHVLRETVPFFEFSLCLSRACLGKVIRFGIKRGNFRPFSYLHRAEQPVADEVACGAVRENAILFA